MENEWLKINKRKIDNMQYQLTELAYKRESPGVPFEQFRGMIGSAVVEIRKLQAKVNELNEKLKKRE